MLALVQLRFSEHPCDDVRLSVASCHSEIIRITTPVAPYNDDILKNVLQSIVENLQGLHDDKAPTFGRRTKILEIMARARSFILMLDLQCDKMILHMFHCFIVEIRKRHPNKVKIAMFDILSMILDEKDAICEQMRSDLLGIWRTKLHVSAAAYDLSRNLIELEVEKFREQLTSEELIMGGLQVSPPLQVRDNLDVDGNVSAMITPITLPEDNNKDNDCHTVKDEFMELESFTAGEGFTELFIGDVQIFIDKTVARKDFLEESTCDHTTASIELHDENIPSSSESAKLEVERMDRIGIPCIETLNLGIGKISLGGISADLILEHNVCIQDIAEEEIQSQSDASHSLHSLWNQLKVNDGIVAALCHHDEKHKLVENYFWMV
ncbi:hypothetical protein SUGI_0685290 [Cryptomeria japonica]|nr:hypothetical protein SUGI_0685290 [Cryptomeria japonica]